MPEIPYPLLADISAGRCLPFIGAGFSLNAQLPPDRSMPNWNELAKSLAVDLKLTENLSSPAIASRYQRRFGRVQLIEAVRKALHFEYAHPGEVHTIFASLPFDTVYTTNFDLLLEEAYAAIGRPYRSLVGEQQMPFHAGQTASSVVKMHGDLRHEEHIILTESDYSSFVEKYPVIATHLSAMLITRTPLFIGYSLTDADFLSIRDVVRTRLGQFERMAYVVQFDYLEEEIEKSFQDNIHIISLKSYPPKSKSELLREFLLELLNKLDTKASIRFRASRPDAFETISTDIVEKTVNASEPSVIVESTSSLCFVMMPFGEKYDVNYWTIIAPAAAETGMIATRADQISAPGFIMEQIRAAIQQSRLCIADVSDSNPNVLYELGIAQAMGKPTIVMANSIASLPFNIAHMRVIRYDVEPEQAKSTLIAAIQSVLTENRVEEANRLLQAGQYRASIAISSILLEQHMRSLVSRRDFKLRDKSGLGELLRTLISNQIIDPEVGSILQEVIAARNKAVHGIDEPDAETARFVVHAVREFLLNFN